MEDLIARSKDAGGVEHIDKVCIIGLDGGAPWTTASHANALKLDGREGANITRCFKSGDFTPFMTDGVHAEGVHSLHISERGRRQDSRGNVRFPGSSHFADVTRDHLCVPLLCMYCMCMSVLL